MVVLEERGVDCLEGFLEIRNKHPPLNFPNRLEYRVLG